MEGGGRDPLIRPGIPRHRFTDLNLLPLSVRIGSYAAQILRWGFIEPTPWRNYLHRHSFCEICYAFQGAGTFRILGVDYQVRAGDVFVARPGQDHEIISAEHDALGIYHWSYTLVPLREPSPAAAFAADALLDAFLASDAKVGGQTYALEPTLELLTEEAVRREPGYRLAIEGLVVKLLLDTARSVVDVATLLDPTDPPCNPVDVLAQTIVRYLRDNYSRPISLRDVATQVHLSEHHTNRLFRAATGQSIMRSLTALRLEIAAQLLLNRQLSVKEVAYKCGYPDVHYFTTLFHRRTGLTPTHFREQGGTIRFFPHLPAVDRAAR